MRKFVLCTVRSQVQNSTENGRKLGMGTVQSFSSSDRSRPHVYRFKTDYYYSKLEANLVNKHTYLLTPMRRIPANDDDHLSPLQFT